jgi:hypothetical protein
MKRGTGLKAVKAASRSAELARQKQHGAPRAKAWGTLPSVKQERKRTRAKLKQSPPDADR